MMGGKKYRVGAGARAGKPSQPEGSCLCYRLPARPSQLGEGSLEAPCSASWEREAAAVGAVARRRYQASTYLSSHRSRRPYQASAGGSLSFRPASLLQA